jgi:Flp pilus assembly protein TadG
MTKGRGTQKIRVRLGCDRGVAVLEFAFIAPLLLALLIAGVELGLAIRTELLAQEAAAAGAQYAIQGFDATAITSAVQNVKAGSGLLASPAPAEFYACPAASGLTHTTQGTTCTDGAAARHYVDVWASIARPTVMGASFGLPATLTAHAVARAP